VCDPLGGSADGLKANTGDSTRNVHRHTGCNGSKFGNSYLDVVGNV
jgi:hypothetical protein